MNRARLKEATQVARHAAKDPSDEPITYPDGTLRWEPGVVVPVRILNTLLKAATKELSR